MKKSKKLSILEMVGYGVGNCIGAGVFVYMGTAIGFTGRSLPIALLLANTLMLFAYAYNTLMVGTFPLSGGKYAQGAVLQPPLIAGVTAVSTIIGNVAIASFPISIVMYLTQVFPGIAPYSKLIAIAVQTFFFAVTLQGTKFMAKLNITMVAVLTVALTAFVAVGLSQVRPGAFAFQDAQYFSGGAFGLLSAVAMMGFACQGSTILVSFASDAEAPTRKIPIAILLTTAIVGVIYFLMSIVAAGVLPVAQIANQSLAVTAEAIFSQPVFVAFVIGGPCFAIATSLFTAISTMKYPALSAVEDGWLPAFIGKTTKNGYPWVIMLSMYILAIFPILTDMSIEQVASYFIVPTMFLSMLNNILFLKIPKQYPNAWKKSFFHMPRVCLVLIVVVSILCDCLVCVAMFTTLEGNDRFMIILVVALSFLYSFLRLRSGKVTMKSKEEARKQAMEEMYEAEHA